MRDMTRDMTGMDLNGLHRSNKLGEGLNIDTTENLEVRKGYTLEGMELIAYTRAFAESTGSILSRDIGMLT